MTTTISIAFHATPVELLEFLREVVSDFNLRVVAMRFFPFDAYEVRFDQLPTVFSAEPRVYQLGLTLDPPNLPAVSNRDFGENNPARLRFDIEIPTEAGLRQCWLTCRTSRFDAAMTWKEVAKRLKAITRTGVVAVNRDTGEAVPVASHRYTDGAKRLADSGIEMLPSAGGGLLKFVPK
jgi:hypothetical protein